MIIPWKSAATDSGQGQGPECAIIQICRCTLLRNSRVPGDDRAQQERSTKKSHVAMRCYSGECESTTSRRQGLRLTTLDE